MSCRSEYDKRKTKEQTGLKFLKKPYTKPSARSGVSPGMKTGAAAETVQRGQTTVHKNMHSRKKMCSKLSAVVATANFQLKKQKIVDFKAKSKQEVLAKL
jgi:hypothetical protein